MAYNNGFYNQYYGNQQMNQQSFQIQNGGFIPVPSEEVARNYPVAPGNSITFKNENAPYVYTKTMGFSQLDRPIFEKFKLVREEDTPNANILPQNEAKINEMKNEPLEELKTKIEALEKNYEELKKRMEDFEA